MLHRLVLGLALLALGAYIGRELSDAKRPVRLRVVKKETPRVPEQASPPARKLILH